MAANIPEIREVSEGQITTVVAEDLEIKGNIKFKTSVMLKGVFDGEITCDGLLVVGQTAKVTAAINTKTLISHGVITGNIIASEQIVLKDTSTHNGDLRSPFIMIENGAVFNGACIMERNASAADTPNIPAAAENEQSHEAVMEEEPGEKEPDHTSGGEENKEPGDPY